MQDKKIKVLIADDMPLIVKRFYRILSNDNDIEVVGTASSGSEAVELSLKSQPDIVLMDIEMETRNAGIEASEKIYTLLPQTKIVILTVHQEDEYVLSAFQAGIVDYIPKSSSPMEVASALKMAYNNNSPIRAGIAEKIRKEFMRIKKSERNILQTLDILLKLTESEFNLIDLVRQGKTRKEIAEIRCVEVSTVKTQINNILKKFNVHSTREIAELLDTLNSEEILNKLRTSYRV